MLSLTMPKRFLLASLGGGLSYFAYPAPDIWGAIFLSIALLFLSVDGLKFFSGFLVGLVGGICFYVAQIYWISQYLGPEPLIALALLEAVFFALAAGFISLLTRIRIPILFQSLLIAGVWVGREWVSTHFPYGGFPWSRIAMSQANSPLAHWVAIGGFGILSFVVVFITVYFTGLIKSHNLKFNAMKFTIALLITISIPLVQQFTPLQQTGTIRVAGIQGNAKAGLFANTEWGEVLGNHLDVTNSLLASGETFELVVWPENASDVSPESDENVSEILLELVDKRLKVPFIFGDITSTGEEVFNSSKLWLPGRGEVDQYDKKRPVPFGEYVPDRDFFYALSPDLVGLITRGYTFGTRDPIFEVAGKRLGILICFEEAIDELPRDAVNAGASLLIAQTNNADFGKSDESVQQLAIAKLRAIETGRSLINVSTVGPSAFINAKGIVLAQTTAYKPEYLVADVPLYENKTLTMQGGWVFDPACAVVSLGTIAWLFVRRLKRKAVEN